LLNFPDILDALGVFGGYGCALYCGGMFCVIFETIFSDFVLTCSGVFLLEAVVHAFARMAVLKRQRKTRPDANRLEHYRQ